MILLIQTMLQIHSIFKPTYLKEKLKNYQLIKCVHTIKPNAQSNFKGIRSGRQKIINGLNLGGSNNLYTFIYARFIHKYVKLLLTLLINNQITLQVCSLKLMSAFYVSKIHNSAMHKDKNIMITAYLSLLGAAMQLKIRIFGFFCAQNIQIYVLRLCKHKFGEII